MRAHGNDSAPIDVFMRMVTPALVATAGCALVQCASAPPPPPATSPPPPAATSSPSVASPPPPVPPPPVSAPPAPAAPTVRPVTAAELGASWRPGCPLEPGRLRLVELNYLGFDGQIHRGELIVHEDLVAEVIAIFEQLHQLRYPIEKIRTVDHYPRADDELSMQDNNTSAFNCRDIPGTGRWSLHAYGQAIDVNPLLNPFIDRTGAFQPRNAAPYLDRNRIDPGLLHDGDPAVLAFTDRGWRWGGHWRTPKDYQHFERR
jgi:D-alanyl-D-alanine carboxypeptidase